MPTLDFKGKPFVYSHHLSVPFRGLDIDASKSLHMRTKLLKYIEVQRSETLELGEKFTQVNSRYGELSENQAGYQKDYDTLLRVVDMQAEKIRRYMSDNFAPAQTFPALSINELEDNSSETSED